LSKWRPQHDEGGGSQQKDRVGSAATGTCDWNDSNWRAQDGLHSPIVADASRRLCAVDRAAAIQAMI
jgi:hypothetical protein